MMYADKMAVAIKTKGKVLREHKDTVLVPFGADYSIYIKNLHSVRALVNITIDGKDVTSGGLVVYGNSHVDLERYLSNNLSVGNKFKFIERTAGVEKARGVGIEDGLIRIEYQFERVPAYVTTSGWKHFVDPNPTWTHPPLWNGVLRGSGINNTVGTSFNSSSTTNAVYSANAVQGECAEHVKLASSSNTAQSFEDYKDDVKSFNDTGITVPGSKSEQKFETASWFPTEVEKHVMVIRLLGETEEGKKVYAPVTVKAKPRCVTCKHQNKANAKFCVECGTALEIFA